MQYLLFWNLFVIVCFTSSWSAVYSYQVVIPTEVTTFGANLGMFTIFVNFVFLAFMCRNYK